MSLVEGFILVDKAHGLSSFQVVKKVRQVMKVKRVGHAGTLDPFATGLLVIAMGRGCTKQIDQVQALKKTYVGSMVLGITTDSLDSDGTITQVDDSCRSAADYHAELDQITDRFSGQISQVPPHFSAKKINGKRAYTLARKGEEFELEARDIHIYNLTFTEIKQGQFPILTFEVTCSKGTYVRSLVRDIAAELGTIAYLKDLCRSHIGPLENRYAIPFAELDYDRINNERFFSLSQMGVVA